MSIIDLHSHTTASDGKLTPNQLIDRAQSRDIAVLAITDHDTLNGYRAAQEYAEDKGIILISGIEVSCLYAGMNIHMLGLDFDAQASSMLELEAMQAKARLARAERIAYKLSKTLNQEVVLDEVREFVTGQVIGRPHFAKYLVSKGWVKDEKTVFDKYLGAGKVGDVKNHWVSIEESAHAILDAGGIPVMAHAHRYKMTNSKLRRCLQSFVEAGGKAMEVSYGLMDFQTQQHQARLALEFGLAGSCGSDFHGENMHGLDLGVMPAFPKQVTPIWQSFKQSEQVCALIDAA